MCKIHHKTSLRREILAVQNSPTALRIAFEKFHAKSSWEQKRRTYTLKDLTNMDQTLLSFVADENRTYQKTSAYVVWTASGQSGLKKRQCTVQLTFVANGSTLPALYI